MEKSVLVSRTLYWEGRAASGVSGFSFETIDPLELFERLVLRAYGIFGCFPDPHFEPVLAVYCDAPEDLAMDTITKLLDPDDHTVQWNAGRGAPRTPGARFMMTSFPPRKPPPLHPPPHAPADRICGRHRHHARRARRAPG